ncbi:L-threonine 3-dehydrogenase [Candidatus Micrarchaeota archaeon]|nr:L-threonine 3-dehydrogenase [Candidatus Micrarchaeota archaeon]
MSSDNMLAVWKTKQAAGLELKDAPIPKIKDDEVLIKVKATSICGTDRHIYLWDAWAQKRIGKNVPYIFGHEVAGEIAEIGTHAQGKGLEIGDHVSAETHISCGYCFQCKTGNEHICENVKILGVDTNGTFAEYLTLPYRNAWKNDKSLPHWVATAQEPLGNAVHTVFDGEIAGKTVSVFGMGPIGICAVALCKEAGAEKIIAVDPNDFRLKFAKDFGADVLVKARDTNVNVQKEILEETDGMGVDVFLEISGSASAITDGIATLRAGGRASILGVFSNPFLLDMNKVVFGNIRLTGINGRRMFDTWYKAASFLRSGKVKLEKLVTHRLKLSEIERGFEILERGEGMKVVLEP